MTNGQVYQIREEISDQAIVLVRECGCDKTKIDDGLWNRLVELFGKVEDYV